MKDTEELIGGQVVTRPENTIKESIATVFLILRLVDKVKKPWVLGGNAQVQVGPNILRPDIMGWADGTEVDLQETPLSRTPDFICEITAGTRVDVDFYRPYVPYLWVLDVENKRFSAYCGPHLFETSRLDVPYVLDPFDFEIKLSEVLSKR
jgi:hypothetical protein